MKHILILEDEQRNANRLVRLLKEIVPEARIDGPLETIEAAAEFLRKAPPLGRIEFRSAERGAARRADYLHDRLRRVCRAGVQV